MHSKNLQLAIKSRSLTCEMIQVACVSQEINKMYSYSSRTVFDSKTLDNENKSRSTTCEMSQVACVPEEIKSTVTTFHDNEIPGCVYHLRNQSFICLIKRTNCMASPNIQHPTTGQRQLARVQTVHLEWPSTNIYTK
jgi:hypothetical protein